MYLYSEMFDYIMGCDETVNKILWLKDKFGNLKYLYIDAKTKVCM